MSDKEETFAVTFGGQVENHVGMEEFLSAKNKYDRRKVIKIE